MRNKTFVSYFTILVLVAIPITIYIANKPQEVRTSAQQVTTPRPTASAPSPTPTPIR